LTSIRKPPPGAKVLSPAKLRDHLWTTRPHRCEAPDCGTYLNEGDLWQADHIFPLHLVDRDDPTASRHWEPENTRILCDACHKKVTERQAKDRGKVRRIRRKRGLDQPVGRLPF
jgi:5-methylcytosine-specific restriction endonuclease McrA